MDRHTYLETIEPVVQLSAAKSEDYNSEGSLDDYFPFGDKSYVQMIYTKAMRLKNLVQSDREANFESKLDTVMDIINYAVYYLHHLQYDGQPELFVIEGMDRNAL